VSSVERLRTCQNLPAHPPSTTLLAALQARHGGGADPDTTSAAKGHDDE